MPNYTLLLISSLMGLSASAKSVEQELPIVFTTSSHSFNALTGENLEQHEIGNSSDHHLVVRHFFHMLNSVIDGGDKYHRLIVNEGGNISGTRINNFEALQLGLGVRLELTEGQFEDFSEVSGQGKNALVISTASDGQMLASRTIDRYVLRDHMDIQLTAHNQHVLGDFRHNQTIRSSQQLDHFTGVLIGGSGGEDTLVIDEGDDFSKAVLKGFESIVSDTEPYHFTMTAAQLADLKQQQARWHLPGIQHLTVVGDGDITTVESVERYRIGKDNRGYKKVTINSSIAEVIAADESTRIDIALNTDAFQGKLVLPDRAETRLYVSQITDLSDAKVIKGVDTLILAANSEVRVHPQQLQNLNIVVENGGLAYLNLASSGAAELSGVSIVAEIRNTTDMQESTRWAVTSEVSANLLAKNNKARDIRTGP